MVWIRRPAAAGRAGATPLAHDISDDAYVDGWGSLWERRPDGIYYEVDLPIHRATIDDLDHYTWPDLAHPSRFAGLRSEQRRSRMRVMPSS